MKNFFGSIGRSFFMLLAGLSRLATLFFGVVHYLFLSFAQPKTVRSEHLTRQMVSMGVDSVPIIMLSGLAVGTVLALQAAYQLKDFGAVLYTGSLVSVSITRELGPLVAAIILSGRVGARIASELGSMTVAEEVDALATMGLNPVRYLVLPRMLGLIIMLPCLTVICNIMGMLGGFLIGTFAVNINPYLYLSKNFSALVLKDVYSGLAKSVIFAVLIGLVSCHQGLSVDGGAEGVGKATTQAVVTSIILIIVIDAVATALFYYLLPS
jgi:phospholipid/cholesterol/gamma-HCH transport system permease protein